MIVFARYEAGRDAAAWLVMSFLRLINRTRHA